MQKEVRKQTGKKTQSQQSTENSESTTISFRKLYVAVKSDNEKLKHRVKDLANKLHNSEQAFLEESNYHSDYKKKYQQQCLETLQLHNLCDKYEKYLRIERTILFSVCMSLLVCFRTEIVNALYSLF